LRRRCWPDSSPTATSRGTCGACDGADACSSAGACVAPTTSCASGAGEQEPNDSALAANALCAGAGRKGKVSSATDQDWYSFTVPAGATYDVRLAGGPATATLRVYKLGTTGRLSFIGDGPDVSRHTTDGGPYVARVMGGGPSTATYTVTATTTTGP